MAKVFYNSLFATTALALTLPTAAFAQEAADRTDSQAQVGEILVLARRTAERLQDVPVSVQVVTGEALANQNITSVDEIGKLAPGLSLVNAGANTSVTLRGVTWQPGSGTPATPIYFNEVPFNPGDTISTLFDIGQIEVQRGPQGTTRGAPSISGAVTVTTKKPDLAEWGGYVSGFYGQANHSDIQGAISIPLIKDVLAVRLAANIEDGEGSRIYSVNSNIKPLLKDRTLRATVLLKPTDTLTFNAMYQRRKTQKRFYAQVVGTGSPGFAAIRIPANFNGPALTGEDRAAVQDRPGSVDEHYDILTASADWEVLGHTVSYNYGRAFSRNKPSFAEVDPLNILPGFSPFTSPSNIGLPKFVTNEARISSIKNPDRPFDYDIGWFSRSSDGVQNFDAPTYLPGAFGNPATAFPGAVTTPNPAYVLNSSTNIGLGQRFDSFYGNIRFYITDRTELSGGIAILKDSIPVAVDIKTFAARVSSGSLAAIVSQFPAQFQPLITSCEIAGAFARNPLLVTSQSYPGTCDAALPNGFRNSSQSNNDKYSKAVYKFSLSHKFNDDFMVYATTGSSYRSGLPAINNPGLPSIYLTPKPETAKSYELGVKSAFSRNLQVNLAVFQLDYKDQLTTFEGVRYFNTVANAVAQTSLAFYRNIDARVRGFELEIAARPIDNLTLGANVSYSQIKSQGGTGPCNDVTRPINAANPINTCPIAKGTVLNTQAPFQASFNGAYQQPLTDSMGAYFRFNVNVQGHNPNFGNFRTGTTFKDTPSYAVADLFLGLNDSDGAWDLGVYAKNAFNKQTELNRILTANTIFPSFAAPSGYDVVRYNAPREIGVSLRYAFGSR